MSPTPMLVIKRSTISVCNVLNLREVNESRCVAYLECKRLVEQHREAISHASENSNRTFLAEEYLSDLVLSCRR